MNSFKAPPGELCILGLGSNLPYRGRFSPELLSFAMVELDGVLTRGRASSIYKTAPLHVKDQRDFFNCCFCGYYRKSPRELLARVQAIENSLGRDRARERRWGERTLDIDILIFGTLVLHDSALIIPHPRLTERSFALRPLLELFPKAREPETGRSYRDIFNSLPDQGVQVFTTPPGPGILKTADGKTRPVYRTPAEGSSGSYI
ncbi:MAG: 2-amino-4-hydroxy-6-hydroxymethyldihydropteridine diphosphokinase [Spirochaetaceae bacterium]|jgi:2-amino-4-hydroxy-6-hydroxymethyldihydropteridine diphosphokinase|nr:2-amino-4-hydroxy-6-hydroxymethyldihydropteridine diphosphokinase [Spirochaetaceae bacterium]